MYPTVRTLMQLWPFVSGEGMTWRDDTDAVRAFLGDIELADLQKPATWPKLNALVRIEPHADVLPTRGPYGDDSQATIGANFLSSKEPRWYTLPDVVASKLLTGRSPKIIEALAFESGPQQGGLLPVAIAGNPAYTVDPSREDFFKRLIELRQATKRRRDLAHGAERDALDAEQNALKIAASSTGYGIHAEINVKERAKRGPATVYSTFATPYVVETVADEEPGRHFHPLLATLITGAARLMLAITERLVTDEGLDWAFCDTDSMAIAKPDFMADDEFRMRVSRVAAVRRAQSL
jgi:hypothetical protein